MEIGVNYFDDYNNYSDEIIVAEIKNDSIKAENILYKKYYNSLFEFISKKCYYANTQDAEDLIQETMIDCIENIRDNRFEHRGTLFAYISKICLYKWIKNNKDKKKLHLVCPLDDIGDSPNDKEEFPYKKYAKIAFKELDDLCKNILILLYYRKRSYNEIFIKFSELGSESNVRKRKYKCMSKLRKTANNYLLAYYKIQEQ